MEINFGTSLDTKEIPLCYCPHQKEAVLFNEPLHNSKGLSDFNKRGDVLDGF